MILPYASCIFLVSLGVVWPQSASALQCYQQSGRVEQSLMSVAYCQPDRYPFNPITHCVKYTSGNVVVRDCDRSGICEPYGSGCMTGALNGQFYSQVCCCSSDRCNSAAKFWANVPVIASVALFAFMLATSLLLILTVNSTYARECYISESRIGERMPSLDTISCRSQYCIKFDDITGVTRRTCDRGGLCDHIGSRCQMVRDYDMHQEAFACCCTACDVGEAMEMDLSCKLDDVDERVSVSKCLLKKYAARGENRIGFTSSALCFNEADSAKHNPPPHIADHPENHKRIERIMTRLRETGLSSHLSVFTEKDVGKVRKEEVAPKITDNYLSVLSKTEQASQESLLSCGGLFDSVFFTNETFNAARSSLALAIKATDTVWNEITANAIVIARPPGHHALKEGGNGFCILNNIAHSALEALKMGAKRILIVDFDVHHGQGIQRYFENDNRVTYFSVHRYEGGRYWPHLRESNFTFVGTGKGAGHTVNVALSHVGADDVDYMAIFWNVLYPLALSLNPDLVFVAAGFDACYGDPLGGMRLTPDLYAHWIYHLSGFANGKVVATLEGGYNHYNQALCVQRCVEALIGSTVVPLNVKDGPSESCAADILATMDCLKWYWPGLNDGDAAVFNDRSVEEEVHYQKSVQHLHRDPEDSSQATFSEQFRIHNARVRPKHPISQQLPSLDMTREAGDTGNINQADLPLLDVKDYRCVPNKQDVRVGFCYNNTMTLHKARFKAHENPDRIFGTFKYLAASGLLRKCRSIEGRFATEEELARVHTAQHLDFLRNVTNQKNLTDNDLYANQHTCEASCYAAGSLIKCVDEVLQGKVISAFALIRPPGHHANASQPKGFCFVNNVAVAARHAREKHGLERILIVDWDVHFGDGTAEIFEEDDSVLYISLHRYEEGFYPHSPKGEIDFVGSGKGVGYTVNIPWAEEGLNDDDYLLAFSKIVMPIASEFNPQLVLVSSGFDACFDENVQLGDCDLTPYGFSRMTYLLGSLANGRIIAALEGGYNLQNLYNCSEAVLTTMVCNAVIEHPLANAPNKAKTFTQETLETIQSVINVQSNHWNCLKPFAVVSE